MMTLYHGSYAVVREPDVTFGRKEVDFGRGFYLTRLRKQVTDWVQVIAGRRPGRKAFFNRYSFDKEVAIAAGFRYREFLAYDLEWLEYVVGCRNGGRLQRQFDIVEQICIHSQRVVNLFLRFESGREVQNAR